METIGYEIDKYLCNNKIKHLCKENYVYMSKEYIHKEQYETYGRAYENKYNKLKRPKYDKNEDYKFKFFLDILKDCTISNILNKIKPPIKIGIVVGRV